MYVTTCSWYCSYLLYGWYWSQIFCSKIASSWHNFNKSIHHFNAHLASTAWNDQDLLPCVMWEAQELIFVKSCLICVETRLMNTEKWVSNASMAPWGRTWPFSSCLNSPYRHRCSSPLKAALQDFTAWIQLILCMDRMWVLQSGSSWPIIVMTINILPKSLTMKSGLLSLVFLDFFILCHFPPLSPPVEQGRVQ